MAVATPGITPGAQYHTDIAERSVTVRVDTPMPLELTEDQATVLDAQLHNAVEGVLALYWDNQAAQPVH